MYTSAFSPTEGPISTEKQPEAASRWVTRPFWRRRNKKGDILLKRQKVECHLFCLKKNGAFYIAEAKGGSSTLAGGQMTASWIRRNIDKIGGKLGSELQQALRDQKIYGLVTSTPIDRVTGEIQNPSYILKHLSKL